MQFKAVDHLILALSAQAQPRQNTAWLLCMKRLHEAVQCQKCDESIIYFRQIRHALLAV